MWTQIKIKLIFKKGYNIKEYTIIGPKYKSQIIGPYKILQKIGQLIYKFNFLFTLYIHFIVLIAQLKLIYYN